MKQVFSSRITSVMWIAAFTILSVVFILHLGFIYQAFYLITQEMLTSLAHADEYVSHLSHH